MRGMGIESLVDEFQTASTLRLLFRAALKYPAIFEFLCGTRSLQILLRPVVDAVESFLQILQRIGDAEAQITFPEFAE
jgi:hypothetical protein